MGTSQASQVPFASTSSSSFSSPPAPKTLVKCKSLVLNLKLNKVCSPQKRKNGGGVLVVVEVGKEDTQQVCIDKDEEEEDLQCVRQIQRVLELLRKNRDMLFSEVKLTVMIEDPREVERRRLLGIEDPDAPTRDDLVDTLEQGRLRESSFWRSEFQEDFTSIHWICGCSVPLPPTLPPAKPKFLSCSPKVLQPLHHDLAQFCKGNKLCYKIPVCLKQISAPADEFDLWLNKTNSINKYKNRYHGSHGSFANAHASSSGRHRSGKEMGSNESEFKCRAISPASLLCRQRSGGQEREQQW